MTPICTWCDEEVDEADWQEEAKVCTACFDDSGGSDVTKYCCGQIYEEGEDTCMSCGEPL